MRFLIVGGGAVGLVVGAYLSRSRHEVTVIARPDRATAISREGLTLVGLSSMHLPLDVRPESAGVGEVDALLYTTKLYDLASAVEANRHVTAGTVASLSNGVGKESVLCAGHPLDVVVGSTTFIGGLVEAPTRVRHSVKGTTVFGPLPGVAHPAILSEVVEAFEGAGLPCRLSTAVRGMIWSKQAIQATMVPLTLVSGLSVSGVLEDPDLAAAALAIMRDVLRVAACEDLAYDPFPDWGFPLNELLAVSDECAIERLQRRGAHMREHGEGAVMPSLLRDIATGRRTEVDDTLGRVVAMADRCGVEAPCLRQAYRLVKGIARKHGTS